jgi:uncharacterized protein YdeI (BOF family)
MEVIMNKLRTVSLLVLLALAVTLAPAPTAEAHPVSHHLPIAAARLLPLGTVVTVEGSVTVPSGAFASGTFDQGFAVQDHSGGIYVSVATDLDLSVRQRIRVTGQLADSFGLRILVPASAADVTLLHGRGPLVRPMRVPTGTIGEATEGRLVEIAGTITQPIVDDRPYGFRILVDDGSGELQVFVYASTGIDVSGLQPGQHVSITGFSGQFDDHYELNPRFPADVVQP